ncbi:MAG: hypothetical protein A2987_02035 [Omnitrophica bacterium RIFCSPLOWO2_01_FULL_45_10]|nr:MAG: hypothetical protein A2987_02035 [Omnitrophica bacterium RIFCSPLOWO2_01_FULL_45_10]
MRILAVGILLIAALLTNFLAEDPVFADTSDSVTILVTVSSAITTAIDYTYDDINRLESVRDTNTSTAYTYDEVGNIITKTTGERAP